MNLKSINYWSYPGGFDGTFPVASLLQTAKDQGFDAVEICIGISGEVTPETTQAQCEDILAKAHSVGIQVASVASGLYWGNAIGDADESSRAIALRQLDSMLQITAWLRCKTLLTITGAVDVFFMPDRPVQDYASVEKYSREGLKHLAPKAEALGVRMGLENVWNKFLLSPSEMAQFIDSIESAAVGAYVDVANVLPYGYPEQWLRYLGKRVAGVHFKDFRRAVGTGEGFVDLLEGDVNWPEVMKAISEIGYEGPVVAEMIPHYGHHPIVRSANASRAMDAILGRS
ncbi:MAG: sugar phosphate isomerase/epimerase [Armatimonadetes bacterium]|nr:sugar phosphate isomerase/epimerase [Armatimonadota bacterium]